MTIRKQITNVVRALAEIPAVVEMAREANEMRRTHIETALRLQLAKKQAHIERLQYRCSKAGADVSKALRDMAKWRDKAEASMRGAEELTLRMSRTEQLLTERTGMLTDERERSDRLSNDIGPARAIISDQKRQLEHLREQLESSEQEAKRFLGERDAERQLTSAQSEAMTKLQQENRARSARIRELETQAERNRSELEELGKDSREYAIQRDGWASKCSVLSECLRMANEQVAKYRAENAVMIEERAKAALEPPQ